MAGLRFISLVPPSPRAGGAAAPLLPGRPPGRVGPTSLWPPRCTRVGEGTGETLPPPGMGTAGVGVVLPDLTVDPPGEVPPDLV